jgi:hypothetical protein
MTYLVESTDHTCRFDYDLTSQIRDAASSPSTLAAFLQDPAFINTLNNSTTRKRSKARRRPSSPHHEPHGSSSTGMMGMVLAEEERQASHLKAILKSTGDRLEHEIDRANRAEKRSEHAEARAREIASRVSSAEAGQHAAELHSIRLKEEIQRLQIQVGTMQRDLRRAQGDVDALERQKAEAEQNASKSRDVARKFQKALNDFQDREELMEDARRTEIQRWYDVGRQEGFEEGKEDGYREGKLSGLEASRNAHRSREWDQGREEGRKEERQNALRAFDKFLLEEMHGRRYHSVRMFCMFLSPASINSLHRIDLVAYSDGLNRRILMRRAKTGLRISRVRLDNRTGTPASLLLMTRTR